MSIDAKLRGDVSAVISTVFAVTNGLSLAQVREMTGLSTATVQNWVKRGWVAGPKDKRYDEEQVARIFIINMLRDGLQLEKIALLLKYVNGSVDDRSDDIIPETQLFSILCSVIFDLDGPDGMDISALDGRIKAELTDYHGPFEGSEEKLARALRVMLLAYASGRLKKQTEDELGAVLSDESQGGNEP